ncbi:hypothetical protein [Rhabdothermincola sediminis]|uniref:hypothetical protein n=1 Tax=Rhabdothermincola sediminis TaxID=2751370 RepID=UPI001AA099EB|nr:hypothetical protein [Rhabdothermincola sediminis]
MTYGGDDGVTLRGAAGLGARGASVEVDDDGIVVHARSYTAQPIRIRLEALTAVVDLRDRRARRLPTPLSLGRTATVAGVGTASPQSPLHRATIGLVFTEPTALPEVLPGARWDHAAAPGDESPPPVWDALALNAGKHTDQLLAILARRGTRRVPSLASGITLAASGRAGGSAADGLARREQSAQVLALATICLALVAILALVLMMSTDSPSWLGLLVLAVPAYLYGTSRLVQPRRRGPRRGIHPSSAPP